MRGTRARVHKGGRRPRARFARARGSHAAPTIPPQYTQATPLARYARSLRAPVRLVLRAAARLMLAVCLLPTGSNALAFRAVCSRASLPQCAYMFGGSPAPCGGRAYRGGPRPAVGLNALRRQKPPPRSCALEGAALATLGRNWRDAPAASATLRP